MKLKGLIPVLVTLGVMGTAALVGLLWFSPAPQAAGSPSTAVQFDPVEWSPEPLPPLGAPTTNLENPEATPAAPAPSAETFVVTLVPAAPASPAPVGAPPPSTAPLPNSGAPATVTRTAPAPSSAPAPTPATSAPRPSAPVSAPAPTPPRPAPVRVTEYWIQVAALSDRFRAEEVVRDLADRGLKASLFTTTAASGTPLVRVRVGPYSTTALAEQHLGPLKALPAYASAQIWQTTVTR